MPKFLVQSGNLSEEVEALSAKEAALQVVARAPKGTSLGLVIRTREVGKRPMTYRHTEDFLKAHGMWEGVTEEPMVELHAITCDCERCHPA